MKKLLAISLLTSVSFAQGFNYYAGADVGVSANRYNYGTDIVNQTNGINTRLKSTNYKNKKPHLSVFGGIESKVLPGNIYTALEGKITTPTSHAFNGLHRHKQGVRLGIHGKLGYTLCGGQIIYGSFGASSASSNIKYAGKTRVNNRPVALHLGAGVEHTIDEGLRLRTSYQYTFKNKVNNLNKLPLSYGYIHQHAKYNNHAVHVGFVKAF